MQPKRLLMISTDRKIFQEGSAVRMRQAEYAKNWDEVHIIIFDTRSSSSANLYADKSDEKVGKENDGEENSGKKNSNNSKSETVIAPNCWAYSTKSISKFLYPFDAIRLGRFLIERRGITEITCQDASLTAMAGISLKKQFNIPLEIQIHEDIGSPNFGYNFSNKIRKTLALSYLPKADRIRVVSNKIKEYLVGPLGIDGAKITVKPIAVDLEKIRSAPIIAGANLREKYPQFEKIVLMASRLEKEKNVELAIRAWVEVVKKVPKVGLVIVGDGREKVQLKKMAVQAGMLGGGLSNLVGQENSNNLTEYDVNGSVVFEPWVDQSTLISYYKTADIFLNTSLFEGYGMTLVEAQAAGCKVVSTDVGVAREVGATIVGWDEEEVAEGIISLLL